MFSLILPAHNEGYRLTKCVNSVRKVLRNQAYELIIVEDGSTDNTARLGENLAKKYKNVSFYHLSDSKLGRGRALKKACKLAKGNQVGYMDVDMATDLKHLPELIKLSKKYDLVTGSRYLPDSQLSRPGTREFFSQGYNLLIRLFLAPIYDSQCGFKAFSHRFINQVINKIDEPTWAWDTVVLVLAHKKGFKVKEFPVVWKEGKEAAHSASLKRNFKDTKLHGTVLLKLIFRQYKV